jgi:hypothetical protein
VKKISWVEHTVKNIAIGRWGVTVDDDLGFDGLLKCTALTARSVRSMISNGLLRTI